MDCLIHGHNQKVISREVFEILLVCLNFPTSLIVQQVGWSINNLNSKSKYKLSGLMFSWKTNIVRLWNSTANSNENQVYECFRFTARQYEQLMLQKQIDKRKKEKKYQLVSAWHCLFWGHNKWLLWNFWKHRSQNLSL